MVWHLWSCYNDPVLSNYNVFFETAFIVQRSLADVWILFLKWFYKQTYELSLWSGVNLGCREREKLHCNECIEKKKKLQKKKTIDLHRKQNTHIYITHRWGEKKERKNGIVDNILSKKKTSKKNKKREWSDRWQNCLINYKRHLASRSKNIFFKLT